MEIFEAITTRRSTRRFTEEEVSRQTLEELVKTAMFAPSAKNSRDWEFIVITDQDTKARISEIHPYCKFAKDSAAVIAVCGNMENQKLDGYWVQDCAAAMQNLLLAAHGKGLGATWCGIHPVADLEMAIQEMLDAPSHIVPLGLCVLGHPTDHPVRQPDRFEPEKMHFNRFGGK